MHADGIDPGAHDPPGHQHRAVRHAVHRPAGMPHHVVEESRAVDLGLEPQQVIGAHRPDQVRVRRDRHEHAGGREGGVQEQPDAVAKPVRPQRFGEAQQVVVMHPDQVVLPHQRRQRAGEQVVHPAVSLKLAPLEAAKADLVVQDGPEGAVGEAAVEFVVVPPGQVDGEQGYRSDGALRLLLPGVGDFAAPAEPQPAFLLQRIQHPGRQSSRCGLAFLNRRDAVGDDDKT